METAIKNIFPTLQMEMCVEISRNLGKKIKYSVF
jgi:glutamate formiminotransferase